MVAPFSSSYGATRQAEQQTQRRRRREDASPPTLASADRTSQELSNPEIRAGLVLSPRTVEWHLRKVFTKLEIHSRHEPSSALPSSESELAPA